jgi:uncharacterized protein (TIGR00369 family)
MMEYIPRNPDFRSNIREKLKKQYFMQHLGIELTLIEAGRVEALLEMKDSLEQQNGFLHGGVTASLNDVAAGFAAYTLAGPGESVVTADLRVSYLHPGDAPRYVARGRVVKAGNLLYFCESEVWALYDDGSEKCISRSSSTMVAVKNAVLEERRQRNNGKDS